MMISCLSLDSLTNNLLFLKSVTECKYDVFYFIHFILFYFKYDLFYIIHHCNQLTHYRSCLSLFKESIIGAYIDVDFSENLSVPVKYEPKICIGHISR